MVAYGATIITVIVTATFVSYCQLGDGDILVVGESGVVQRPMPDDDRLFANETTSLCALDPSRDFRTVFQALAGAPPALILATTDGYSNSFSDDQAFQAIGPDILEMVREDGLDALRGRLAPWLREASRVGSGDDITLGMIGRVDCDSVRTMLHEPIASDRTDGSH
jgi:hypothetical protein